MLFPEKMIYLKISIPAGKVDEEIKNIGLSGLLHIDERKGKRVFAAEEKRVEHLYRKTESFLDILGITYRKKWENGDIDITRIEDFVYDLEEKLNKISNLKKKLQRIRKLFETAKSIKERSKDILEPDKLLKNLKCIKFISGIIPDENLEPFLLSLKAYITFPVYGRLSKGSSWFFVFYLEDESTHIKDILGKNQAEDIPAEYFLREKEKEIKEREKEINDLLNMVKDKYLKKLLDYNSFLRLKYKITVAKQPLEIKGDYYIIYGWIPARKLDSFRRFVKYSNIETFPAGEDAPVLLKTPEFFKPFERIIKGFSYPKYGEINPTIPFGITFLIFFGIMFGDVGHGLVLSLVGFFLKKKNRDLGLVLILSGISSSFFGFLYGSFFGFHDIFPHLFISPIYDVEKLLIFSIFVGIIVISLSFILNILSLLRRKKIKNLIFGEGGMLWLLIYWYSIGVFIKAVVFKLDIKWDLVFLILIIFIVFIYIYRKSKSATQSVINVLRELIETVTNTVSFVRLGAFALAHAALFLAVFTIARLLESEGKGLLYWFTIVIGNVFIIVLEGIIVAIQTLRLEYYEFFKRFFVGGGIPYRPFRLD
ncbi:V-type ATP synthase subunit I [Persephonella hydrogeniphila]|nr:V-type ATPase 116kDa subunit family protein [Persephonella hydrogeniphila]